jgi:hypothetical protein
MASNRRAIDIRSLLDKRSYRDYRLRAEQKKTFREVGAIMDLSRNRVHQIYRASVQRIELKKRGGDIWPEYSLSLRAIHCIERAFGRPDVHKRVVKRALESGKLSPGKVHNYGWKTHREVCKWAGVRVATEPPGIQSQSCGPMPKSGGSI